MYFQEVISIVKESLKQYDSAGLINEIKIHEWIIDGLNKFSVLPTMKIESVITIKNNKGKLPETFKSLYSAVKCEPYVYTTDTDSPDILQEFYFYKTREEIKWNRCEPCEIQSKDACIVEKTYLHNGLKANFYYNNLSPLRLNLKPHIKRAICDKDCINFKTENNAVHEISINNKTIYTNFKDGNIFLVYNGYEEDEDGFVIIPDTDQGWMKEYIVNMVKRNIIEEVLINSNNTSNEQFLYGIFSQKEQDAFTKTMGELKMKRVIGGLKKYKQQIKREYAVFNFGDYSSNTAISRTEFIIL